MKHDKYKQLLSALYPLCKAGDFYIEPIPTFVFSAMNCEIPFERSPENATGLDYSKDPPVFLFCQSFRLILMLFCLQKC